MRFLVPPAAKSPVPSLLIWTLRLLATIAFGCGAFLSWRSLQSGPIPGCGGESAWDCEHVLTSAWSRWLEIPVSYLGTLTYAGILAALMLIGPKAPARWQKTAWTLLFTSVVMAAISAIWFTSIQIFSIGKLCPYCLIIHTCGLLLFVLACVCRKQYRCLNTSPDNDGLGNWVGMSVSCGVLGGTTLILGQIVFPHETFVVEQYVSVEDTKLTSESAEKWELNAPGAEDSSADDISFAAPGEFVAPIESVAGNGDVSPNLPTKGLPDEFADDLREPTALAVNSNSVRTALKPIAVKREHRFYAMADAINVYEFPVLGDVEAPNLIVELVDYTCPQCRDMYHHIEAARQYYGDQMAVVVRPIALERSCNPYVTRDHPKHKNACKYVRLALAVWHLAPAKFSEFHHWLMGPENIPDVAEASAFAEELTGVKDTQSSVRSTDMMGMLGDNHLLWKRIGGNLPMLFAGGRLIRGMPRSDEHLIETLAKQFRLDTVSTP